MQADFDSNYPHLDVTILGLNAVGHEAGNAWFTSVAALPWLQDVDTNGDLQSDAWAAWGIDYRDVVILDRQNVPVGVFNLTTQSLEYFEYYSVLRRMFADAATVSPLPGDYNANGQVEQADLDLVLLNWGNPLFNPATIGWINSLPVGGIDQAELDEVLLNWGNTRAALNSAAVPEPPTLVLLALVILCGVSSAAKQFVCGGRAKLRAADASAASLEVC